MTEKKRYSVDELLEKIGSFGLFQIRLICMLSLLEWFISGYQTLLMTFIAAEPKWRCVVNSTECTKPGEFTPKDDYYKSRCNMNRSAWEFTTEFTSVVTDKWKTGASCWHCQMQWEKKECQRDVLKDCDLFDLVCGTTFLASLSSSLVFGGWMISAFFGGFLADKFGRKKLILLMFFMAFFGFVSSFPKVYWLFAVLRLFVGFCKGGGLMPMFVTITEYVGKRHRHVGGTVFWFAWVFSLLSLGGFAYFIRNWRTLSIVIGVLGMCAIVVWPFIPESCRYLLVKGKTKEAEKILRKIAEVNKKEYPDAELIYYKEQTTGDIRDLFHSWSMAHKTLVSWFCWVVIAMVYYGVILSSPSLGGNMYLNYTLTTAMELPAYALGIWTMGRFGRKKSLFCSLVIASLSSIGAVLLTMYDEDKSTGFLAGRITMACIAKLSISLAFAVIYVYSAELFPTVVRSLGMGSSSALGRVGSFTSPYVATLDRLHVILPYTVMGVLSLIAGILCMTLPETRDVPLEEVVKNAQDALEEHELEGKFLLTDGMEKGEAMNGDTHPPAEDPEVDIENKPEAVEDKEVLIRGKNSTTKEMGDNPVG